MDIVVLVFSIVAGLLLLVLLVALHEFGHGIVARRNGVEVEEFGIGFPPRAIGRKVASSILGKNVLYTLNWLPLGGFVKLKGEHDSASKPGDYGAASLWAKTKILFAGVLVNWVTAAVIFTLLSVIGLPKLIDNQFSVASDTTHTIGPVTVAQVTKDSPGESAGLKKGDQIVRFTGQPLDGPADLSALTKQYRGASVEVVYSRDGTERMTRTTLRENNAEGKGFLGVNTTQRSTYRSTWSAPIVGFGVTAQLTWVTLDGLGDMLAKLGTGLFEKIMPGSNELADKKLQEVGDGVAGPVAILGILFPQAAQAGFESLLLITAIISLALAVMNALPIPALDGGRWFVTMLFRVLKKPLTKEREEAIHGYGFLALMALFVLVTYADVMKLVR